MAVTPPARRATDHIVDPDLAAAQVARMRDNTAPLFADLAGLTARLMHAEGDLSQAELDSLAIRVPVERLTAQAQAAGDAARAVDPLHGYRAYHLAYQAQVRSATDAEYCRCHCDLCRAHFGD